MDSKELTTIVVTIVATTVINAGLIAAWALVMKTAKAATTRARVKAMFSRSNLRILGDLFVFGSYAGWLAYLVLQPPPVTGLRTLGIMLCVLGVAFMGLSLLYKFVLARDQRRRNEATLHKPI